MSDDVQPVQDNPARALVIYLSGDDEEYLWLDHEGISRTEATGMLHRALRHLDNLASTLATEDEE